MVWKGEMVDFSLGWSSRSATIAHPDFIEFFLDRTVYTQLPKRVWVSLYPFKPSIRFVGRCKANGITIYANLLFFRGPGATCCVSDLFYCATIMVSFIPLVVFIPTLVGNSYHVLALRPLSPDIPSYGVGRLAWLPRMAGADSDAWNEWSMSSASEAPIVAATCEA